MALIKATLHPAPLRLWMNRAVWSWLLEYQR
ncbi:hypothetical protein L1280_001196 [Deinococcus sp. HSC-46F16]|nr:hypothetical protein [Deinococcus sp. HSC-46F16]